LSTVSNRVVILFGPTAVGKTATVENLNNDDRLPKPVVVVSADSVQVYRGLDIGSAKPSLEERQKLRHELIDILDPAETFCVADFVKRADLACDDILSSGGLPVISGGTAYYVKAFLYGQPPTPPSDPAIRHDIQEMLARCGPEALHAELQQCDPLSAERIAPADLYRISRAIEVFRCSGRPLSSYVPPTERRKRWNSLVIGLDRPRTELYARIDARVEAMMHAGLASEIATLKQAGYGPGDPGMRAIGYAEFFSPELEPDDVVPAIKMHTRRYAKRQLTFMRSIPSVHWFEADDYEGVACAIGDWLKE
jgi:tRNA dimethylallyltransferase